MPGCRISHNKQIKEAHSNAEVKVREFLLNTKSSETQTFTLRLRAHTSSSWSPFWVPLGGWTHLQRHQGEHICLALGAPIRGPSLLDSSLMKESKIPDENSLSCEASTPHWMTSRAPSQSAHSWAGVKDQAPCEGKYLMNLCLSLGGAVKAIWKYMETPGGSIIPLPLQIS